MKLLNRLLTVAAAAFFIAGSALAENAGTVTNHAFALGKGAGTTGYTSLLCGSAQLAVGQTAADPICKTITGDVTIDAAGVTAIGTAKVTSAMLRNSAALSVIGRSANSSGVPGDISCTAASDAVLRESGSVLGCGTIATNGIANNAVTNAKLRQGAGLSVVGNSSASTANVADMVGTADQVMRIAAAGASAGFGSIDLSKSAAVGTSLLALANGGCNAALTASNGGILWSNATQCQILAGTATARLPLLSGASATPVWGAFTLPASVTSGGIPYFSSTSAESSSALLTANAIMLGGGAGVAPATLGSLGTATTVLHGNAAGAPTFGAIVATDVTTNALTNATLAQAGAATLKGNPTNATANVSDFTIQGLTARGAPDAANDKLPIYDNAAGTIKFVTPSQIAGASSGTVTSVTCGTGLTGGTFTTSGTCATDYATKSEQQTGTSAVKTVNPARQQDHDSAAKAWVSWTGATGVVQASYNVTSVTRNSAGKYTIVFTTSFAATTYACHLSQEAVSASSAAAALGLIDPSSRTVSQIQVSFTNVSLSTFTDPTSGFLVCYGRQ